MSTNRYRKRARDWQNFVTLDIHAAAGLVKRALAEDLPDITSEAIFSPTERGTTRFVMKADGILAGIPFAQSVFAILDGEGEFMVRLADGSAVHAGGMVAEVRASIASPPARCPTRRRRWISR